MDVYSFLIQLLNGVQYGLLLFLVASGLTLIFGIMGIINLAHGSFYMIGAYMAFSLSSLTGSLFVAIVARHRARRCCSASCSSGRCSRTSTSATTWSRCCSPTG